MNLCPFTFFPEMEAKLRVLINDRIEKLILPLRIPPNLEDLQSYNWDLWNFRWLQSSVSGLTRSDQIKHTDTIKVVFTAPILLNFFQWMIVWPVLQVNNQLSVTLLQLLGPLPPRIPPDEVPQKDVRHGQSSSVFHSLRMKLKCTLKKLIMNTRIMEHSLLW